MHPMMINLLAEETVRERRSDWRTSSAQGLADLGGQAGKIAPQIAGCASARAACRCRLEPAGAAFGGRGHGAGSEKLAPR